MTSKEYLESKGLCDHDYMDRVMPKVYQDNIK